MIEVPLWLGEQRHLTTLKALLTSMEDLNFLLEAVSQVPIDPRMAMGKLLDFRESVVCSQEECLN
jgi:hypothetical protein